MAIVMMMMMTTMNYLSTVVVAEYHNGNISIRSVPLVPVRLSIKRISGRPDMRISVHGGALDVPYRLVLLRIMRTMILLLLLCYSSCFLMGVVFVFVAEILPQPSSVQSVP